MATYIKTLKEDNGDITYPQTKAGAVLLTNGSDLETELSQYVTAEDIASTAALTPPVQTNMIADGAVTSDKIDWTTLGGKIGIAKLMSDQMWNSGTHSIINFYGFPILIFAIGYVGSNDYSHAIAMPYGSQIWPSDGTFHQWRDNDTIRLTFSSSTISSTYGYITIKINSPTQLEIVSNPGAIDIRFVYGVRLPILKTTEF